MKPPRRKRGQPSAEDLADWARFAATIAPLPGRAVPALPPPPPEPSPPPAPSPPGAARTTPPVPPAGTPPRPGLAPLAVGQAPGGVDRASWRRLAEGRMATERKLDLHGRTVEQAQRSLTRFLEQAQADGVRMVEVVTGRGGLRGEGAIRRELPHWLNLPRLRPLILAAVHPHAANPGAVRLLLRRVRA